MQFKKLGRQVKLQERSFHVPKNISSQCDKTAVEILNGSIGKLNGHLLGKATCSNCSQSNQNYGSNPALKTRYPVLFSIIDRILLYRRYFFWIMYNKHTLSATAEKTHIRCNQIAAKVTGILYLSFFLKKHATHSIDSVGINIYLIES
jgi:hypothetical protein